MTDSANDGRHFIVPGATRHDAPDRPVRTRRIDLDLRPDLAAKTIDAIAALTVEAVDAGVPSVTLDAVDLEIDAVHALGANGERGDPLRFDARSATLTVWFGRELARDETFRFEVAYRAIEPRRGVYFTEPDRGRPQKPRQLWTQSQDSDARFWVPCQDSPDVKAATSATIRVPRGLYALSNGALVERREDDDGTTFVYRQDLPHAAYLLTLVVGEFVEIDQPGTSAPCSYSVPPGREADGERSFGRTPEMMAALEAFAGTPYPFARYTQIAVADFVMGGMENTTATTQTDDTLHDARAHLDYSSEPLVSHELAHQWFGDLLTTREWSHAWLNEGFASYCEAVYWEATRGWDEYCHYVREQVARYLDESLHRYDRPIVANVYCDHSDLFDRHLYEKGSAVLHMLRGTLGHERFARSIARYVTDHAGGSVETLDLVRAIEGATGRNMRAFFDRWILAAGHPVVTIEYAWDAAASVAVVTIEQTQPIDETRPPFEFDLAVGFVRDAPSGLARDLRTPLPDERRVRLEVRARKQIFAIPCDAEPAVVRVDPGAYVLGDVRFELGTDAHVAIVRGDPDVVARGRAAKALAADGSRAAERALREALGDPFWGVAATTATALGETRAAWARELLAEAATHAHPKVRRAVALALGGFARDERAAATLETMLRDESYFVVNAALTSLGTAGGPASYEILLAHLAEPSWAETIASGAAAGLGVSGDARAAEPLIEASGDDRPPKLRRAALRALAELSLRQGGERSALVETIGRALADPLIEVQRAAIAAAEIAAHPALQPELARLKSRTQRAGVRRDAQDAYDTIERSRRVPAAVASVRRELESLRHDVAELRHRLAPDAPARDDDSAPAPRA